METTTNYDPTTGEQYETDCSSLHRPTDTESLDCSELPALIESDFRHDPVEGCQGSFTKIIEIESCPVCGYDRADHAVLTLAGVHRLTCRACGTDITDRDTTNDDNEDQ